VDLNNNGKIFTMDSALYAKELKDDGELQLNGVTAATAIIAIDRHGNESKPTPISE
jgi:hypothetical protein